MTQTHLKVNEEVLWGKLQIIVKSIYKFLTLHYQIKPKGTFTPDLNYQLNPENLNDHTEHVSDPLYPNRELPCKLFWHVLK